MDKKQALEILNNAVSQINTTRQNHEMLVQALKVLAQELPVNKPVEKKD